MWDFAFPLHRGETLMYGNPELIVLPLLLMNIQPAGLSRSRSSAGDGGRSSSALHKCPFPLNGVCIRIFSIEKGFRMAEAKSNVLRIPRAEQLSQTHWHYEIYGQRLCSNVPLSETSRASFTVKDVAFSYVPPGVDCGVSYSATQLLTRGTTDFGCSLSLYATDQGPLIRWEGKCDFLISEDGRHIQCHTSEDTDPVWARNILYSAILPYALHLRRMSNFHASAVVLSGSVAAFMAEPGGGKSTLAASFAVAGHPFLTDDILALQEGPKGYTAYPGFPNVSLSSKALDNLYGPAAGPPRISMNGEKRRLAVEDLHMPFSYEPMPLSVMFVLNRRGPKSSIKVELLSRIEAVRCLLEHTNCLPLLPPKLLERQMAFAARLSDSVPVYRLVYPSSWKYMPQVISAILEHHHTLESPVTQKS